MLRKRLLTVMLGLSCSTTILLSCVLAETPKAGKADQRTQAVSFLFMFNQNPEDSMNVIQLVPKGDGKYVVHSFDHQGNHTEHPAIDFNGHEITLPGPKSKYRNSKSHPDKFLGEDASETDGWVTGTFLQKVETAIAVKQFNNWLAFAKKQSGELVGDAAKAYANSGLGLPTDGSFRKGGDNSIRSAAEWREFAIKLQKSREFYEKAYRK